MLGNVDEFLLCVPYVGIWALVVGIVEVFEGGFPRISARGYIIISKVEI